MPTRPDIPTTDSENEIVIQEIFDGIPLVSILTFAHTASGSTSTKMPLRWLGNDAILHTGTKGPPLAALIIRVVDDTNRSGNPGNFRVGLNFDYRSNTDGTSEVLLYEPEGLTADRKYWLTVMFMG